MLNSTSSTQHTRFLKDVTSAVDEVCQDIRTNNPPEQIRRVFGLDSREELTSLRVVDNKMMFYWFNDGMTPVDIKHMVAVLLNQAVLNGKPINKLKGWMSTSMRRSNMYVNNGPPPPPPPRIQYFKPSTPPHASSITVSPHHQYVPVFALSPTSPQQVPVVPLSPTPQQVPLSHMHMHMQHVHVVPGVSLSHTQHQQQHQVLDVSAESSYSTTTANDGVHVAYTEYRNEELDDHDDIKDVKNEVKNDMKTEVKNDMKTEVKNDMKTEVKNDSDIEGNDITSTLTSRTIMSKETTSYRDFNDLFSQAVKRAVLEIMPAMVARAAALTAEGADHEAIERALVGEFQI